MKCDCILAHRFWAQSRGLMQPHANVVTPEYSYDGFAGVEGESLEEDPWPDDVPWQGQQEGATPQCDVGMPVYGSAYAPLTPQPDWSTRELVESVSISSRIFLLSWCW